MVASMRNVVVGATVAATSVSFVSAGKPVLFQAGDAVKPVLFCTDPAFKTEDNQSFTTSTVPTQGGYFLVTASNYDYYSGQFISWHEEPTFMGFDFVAVADVYQPKGIPRPTTCDGSPTFFADKRCEKAIYDPAGALSSCDQTIQKKDACGVTADDGNTPLTSFLTPFGLQNWQKAADYGCCIYDQALGSNLVDYYSHWLNTDPEAKNDKFVSSNCANLYKRFLSNNKYVEDKKSLANCKTSYVSFSGNDGICNIKPYTLA